MVLIVLPAFLKLSHTGELYFLWTPQVPALRPPYTSLPVKLKHMTRNPLCSLPKQSVSALHFQVLPFDSAQCIVQTPAGSDAHRRPDTTRSSSSFWTARRCTALGSRGSSRQRQHSRRVREKVTWQRQSWSASRRELRRRQSTSALRPATDTTRCPFTRSGCVT